MNTNVVFSIARTGIDKTIPIIPNKFPKIAIVISIDKGCKFSPLPCTFGVKIFPSICWTISTTMIIPITNLGFWPRPTITAGRAPKYGPIYGITLNIPQKTPNNIAYS